MAALARVSREVEKSSAPAAVLTRFLHYVRRNPAFGVGLVILLALVLFSTVGTLFIDLKKAPYPLGAPPSKPPSWQYPFGTDAQGRNLLPTMIVGTRDTLRIGLLAGSIGVLIGTILGVVAGFYGGIADTIIKWVVDVMLTIPAFLILIVIASMLKDFLTVETTALILALLAWFGPTRTIRSQVLSLRERPFIMMARLSGMSEAEIIAKEIIPNLIPFLLAIFIIGVSAAILASLGLGLLGMGSQREPTLGMTLYWIQKYSAMLRGLWWWWTIPAAIMVLLVGSLTLISFGLDEWANPRTRRAA
jgi:peptide/nickel transport system permease protein